MNIGINSFYPNSYRIGNPCNEMWDCLITSEPHIETRKFFFRHHSQTSRREHHVFRHQYHTSGRENHFFRHQSQTSDKKTIFADIRARHQDIQTIQKKLKAWKINSKNAWKQIIHWISDEKYKKYKSNLKNKKHGKWTTKTHTNK